MKKIVVVTCIVATLAIIAYLQLENKTTTIDPRGPLFAGAAACAKCHASVYNSYLRTAHYLASAAATENTVHGSFAAGANVFNVNETQKVVMEKLKSGLFQTYYVNGKMTEKHRFDIVFGGVKGESYLYWQGNYIDQLPLSYFSRQHEWSTSPGLGLKFIDYGRNRFIGMRCLECHTSYINYAPGGTQGLSGREEFDKATLVYHIDCERCHGPGAQHVDFQTRNPEIKVARYIRSYRSLSRSQKMDMCAVCHSAPASVMVRSAFEFEPGDTLSKFKMPEFPQRIDTSHLDVHGNQVQLLESSKCFRYSKMDCSTCHDTHQNTRGMDAVYTQICLTCHNTPNHVYCKMTNRLSVAMLKAKCIDCHMPALPTNVISVKESDKTSVRFYVHTHHIAIYPEETNKILAFITK